MPQDLISLMQIGSGKITAGAERRSQRGSVENDKNVELIQLINDIASWRFEQVERSHMLTFVTTQLA